MSERMDGGGEGGQHWAPVTGKRQRQAVEHFVPPSPSKGVVKKTAGQGTALRELGNVVALLGRVKGKDAICGTLHRVMYGSVGTESKRKGAVLDFKGFELAEGKPREGELEKVRVRIDKLKGEELREMCKLLDLGWGGTKGEVVGRLMGFLEAPQASGRRQPMASAMKAAGRRPAKGSSSGLKANAKGVTKKKHEGPRKSPAKQKGKAAGASSGEGEAVRRAVMAYLALPTTDMESVTNKMVRKEMEAQFGKPVDKAIVTEAVNSFLEGRIG